MKKKILITGVAGFIGYSLASNLLSQGYKVYGIDNFECDSLFNDYSVDKFHFHVKIKYGVEGMIIKFYNTYPINPFINYYDN